MSKEKRCHTCPFWEAHKNDRLDKDSLKMGDCSEVERIIEQNRLGNLILQRYHAVRGIPIVHSDRINSGHADMRDGLRQPKKLTHGSQVCIIDYAKESVPI